MRLPIGLPQLPTSPSTCILGHGGPGVLPLQWWLVPITYLPWSTQLGHDMLVAAAASLILASWTVFCWRLRSPLGERRLSLGVFALRTIAIVATALVMLALLYLWLWRWIYSNPCFLLGARMSNLFALFDRIALVVGVAALLVPITGWLALRRGSHVSVVGF